MKAGVDGWCKPTLDVEGQMAFWDDQGLLFMRRDSNIQDEYRLLDPSDMEYLRLLKRQGRLDSNRLRAELSRHQAEAGASGFDTAFQELLR